MIDYANIFHVDCEELNGSKYGKMLDKALRELDRDILFDSKFFHGDDHVMRTMALGAYVAKGERYTDEETWLLLMCCSYHDIGRVDDHGDLTHGPKAAEMIMHGDVHALNILPDEQKRIAAAAISVHSQDDDTAPEYEKQYSIRDHELYMKMMRGVKDADNLDRVRLRDIDTKYLRTETAKNGVGFAEKLLKIIPPRMEPYWLNK